MKIKKRLTLFLLLTAAAPVLRAQQKTIDQRVDSVLQLMTLEEKAGQMNQYASPKQNINPATGKIDIEEEIKAGRVGSFLTVRGMATIKAWQEMAMHSRLKIPLLFADDVIHGYRTTFPIPLAEACSWDLAAIEQGARVAGIEASAGGLNWTFAPMVDISRDPRWGRIMEGAGEDTYLGTLIAAARVRGFQGKGLGNTDAVMACAKHFVAYGAVIGGRDYNAVDMSLHTLWETYLPPFKAAADAGVATFMNAYNDLNGVPATASSYLQRDILKGKWNFKGFVVSDWASVGGIATHGYAKDPYGAADAAIHAGSDMDMMSKSYIENLPKLVHDGKVPEALLDDAVRRILKIKFEMGLFDDPFRFCNTEREKKEMNNPAHRVAAKEMAEKSIVLLKNKNSVLPLSKSLKTIALIGPLANSKIDMLGAWRVAWPKNDDVVTQLEGLQNKLGKDTKIIYAKGCGVKDSSETGFAEAIAAAKQADVVIVSVGESADMSGEGQSRSNIHIPGVQEKLVQALKATGKPLVALINAGRPLVFDQTASNADAILYTWWLGSEEGNAVADVLFGDYNPSAKLTVSFPRTEGQIPIYYNPLNGSHPATPERGRYTLRYADLENDARYVFGYGLSYTNFDYADLKLDKTNMEAGDSITVRFTLKNTGKRAGEEVVQLYLRDEVASVLQPVKKLKDFAKINLQPGESREVRFTINKEKLSFYNQNLDWVVEPGTFQLMIGAASDDIRLKGSFELK